MLDDAFPPKGEDEDKARAAAPEKERVKKRQKKNSKKKSTKTETTVKTEN